VRGGPPRRALVAALGLGLVAALPASAEQPGVVERTGAALDRAGRRTAAHVERRATQAGAALQRAGNWVGRKVSRVTGGGGDQARAGDRR
jgi:hypothetical protein